MLSNHKSEILIATSLIQEDVFFQKSVIYLCQNDENGAMGFIINKPLVNENLKDIFHQLNINFEYTYKEVLNQHIYMGGPLNSNKILILHSTENKRKYESSIQLSENLAVTSSIDVIMDLADNILPEYFLPIAGYSCWTKEQLSEEIKFNEWFKTNKLNKDIIFNFNNQNKWQDYIKEIGFSLKKFNNLFKYMGNA